MRESQREDYLLRQLKALAATLARIAGLRLSGEFDAAGAELERGYRALLGAEADLVRRVDPSTAGALLGRAERLLLYARLVREEAGLVTDPGRRAALSARVAALAGEAARRDPENPEIRRFLAEVAGPRDPPAGGSPGRE